MKHVCLSLLLGVFAANAAPEFARDFTNELKSRYFVFHYKDDILSVQEFAKFSDGFIGVIDRRFFKTEFQYPIHVYILHDRSSFKEFLRKSVGIADPPNYGIYFPKLRSFFTFEGSGIGTFAHEIMHPLVQANLLNMPKWADEGLPSFFEKGFGYWNGQDMVLHLGYQNPWRIKELDDRLISLDLSDIVTKSEKYGTSEKRLVSVFLYSQGRLKRFIDLVKQNRKNGYATFVEAAFDRTYSDIQPLWSAYIGGILANREAIYRIPPTEVFEGKDVFKNFMRDNNLKDDPDESLNLDINTQVDPVSVK